MIVRWTKAAIREREEITAYIAEDNPSAALTMDAAFEAAAYRLTKLPLSGRAGKISGTREPIPHPTYRLVYKIDGETILVLALFHTARQWPPLDEADD